MTDFNQQRFLARLKSLKTFEARIVSQQQTAIKTATVYDQYARYFDAKLQ